MIELTIEQAEEIQNLLWQLMNIEDNVLYHHYSPQGLKDRIDEIQTAIGYLN